MFTLSVTEAGRHNLSLQLIFIFVKLSWIDLTRSVFYLIIKLMKAALFWILWGIVSFLAIKGFYYSYSKEKLESLRKAALFINLSVLVLSLLPWMPPTLGGKSALSIVLEGEIPAVLFFLLLLASIALFFGKNTARLSIASGLTIANTFVLFIFMYRFRPDTFTLSIYDIAPIIAFLFLLASDVVVLLLWQQIKLQKGSKDTGTEGNFLQNKIAWFLKLPKLQKGIIVAAGIGLLLLILVPAGGKRENRKTEVPSVARTTIAGKVIDQNGNPVNGAVIASSKGIASAPDGTYKIQADASDTLTVSAYGFETTQVLASSHEVTLSFLTPGTVRVSVVGPDNKEVKDALVYRLNANTFVPVAIGLTNQSGEAVFQDVPGGQAAFVVLSPGYSFAWIQTSLEPGSSIRSVVRLAKLTGEKKSADAGFQFIKTANAQTPTSSPVQLINQLVIEFAQTEKLDNKTYNIASDSETLLAVGTDKERLQKFIDALKAGGFGSKPPVSITGEAGKRLGEIIKKEGSPLTVFTVREGPYDVEYAVEYGAPSGNEQKNYNIRKTEQRNIVVEISRQNPDQSMAVLRAQHAVSSENQPVIVTSWSAAEAAELAGVTNVVYNQPLVTVCCRRPEDDSRGGKGTVPPEASSDTSPPSDLKLTNAKNDAEYLHLSFKKVGEAMGDPYFKTTAGKLVEQNPTLTFTDLKSGKKFSFLDIAPPNPNDAPPTFLLDFFDSPSAARMAFANDPISYKSAWKQYMAYTGSQAFQKQRVTASEFYSTLQQYTGTHEKARLEEERRIARQSSPSAPTGLPQQGQQPQQVNSAGTQDTNSQDASTGESPDLGQDNQSQDDQSQDNQQDNQAQDNQQPDSQQNNTSPTQGSGGSGTGSYPIYHGRGAGAESR